MADRYPSIQGDRYGESKSTNNFKNNFGNQNANANANSGATTYAGGGIGAISNDNFDPTKYGAYGFGMADVKELRDRGHSRSEINDYILSEREARGVMTGEDGTEYIFGTGAQDWMDTQGVISTDNFDKTQYGAYGFGNPDAEALYDQGYFYDEIASHINSEKERTVEAYGTGAADWLEQNKDKSQGNIREYYDPTKGAGKITSQNFKKENWGAFGFGMPDIQELMARGHSREEITAFINEAKEGTEAGSDDKPFTWYEDGPGATWVNSNGIIDESNFDKTEHGAFGFGAEDAQYLADQGFYYHEIKDHVDKERAKNPNGIVDENTGQATYYGSGAAQWFEDNMPDYVRFAGDAFDPEDEPSDPTPGGVNTDQKINQNANSEINMGNYDNENAFSNNSFGDYGTMNINQNQYSGNVKSINIAYNGVDNMKATPVRDLTMAGAYEVDDSPGSRANFMHSYRDLNRESQQKYGGFRSLTNAEMFMEAGRANQAVDTEAMDRRTASSPLYHESKSRVEGAHTFGDRYGAATPSWDPVDNTNPVGGIDPGISDNIFKDEQRSEGKRDEE